MYLPDLLWGSEQDSFGLQLPQIQALFELLGLLGRPNDHQLKVLNADQEQSMHLLQAS